MNKLINELKNKNPHEPLFINAVEEFMSTLGDDYDESVLKVLLNPQRTLIFSVPWIDRDGITQINTGYRVQYNNSLGPYKGGIRFDPSVNLDVMKFLAFEQTLKNALTGMNLGGAKGGSDFDPKNKTDAELLSFCQSFINQIYQDIGPNIDVPAGDIGVGKKEIGYMNAHYKTLTRTHTGVFTGKDISIGGVHGRPEATGYGLIYIVEAYLKSKNKNIKGKKIVISGTGQVAIHAAFKAVELGATVIAMSDRSGYVYNENGLDIQLISEHKNNKQPLSTLKDYNFNSESSIWSIKCDIALPCATQSEVQVDDVTILSENGCLLIAEGANRPLTNDAVNYVQESNIDYIPGKASNAGGVAVSALEMGQNEQMVTYTFEYVDDYLKNVMNDIFSNINATAVSKNEPSNFLLGSNIYSYNVLKSSNTII